MVQQGQSALFTSRGLLLKWTLGIGLTVTCASAAIVIDANRPARPPEATAPATQNAATAEATGTASIGLTPLTMASADVSSVVETPAPPATMLPPEKPKSAVSKVFRVRETTTATPTPAPTPGVAHFDSCLPSCETRDPQIAGLPQPAPQPQVPVAQIPVAQLPTPDADAPLPPAFIPDPYGVAPPPRKGVIDTAVDGSAHLVRKVERASGAVVDGTRRAIDKAVGLVW